MLLHLDKVFSGQERGNHLVMLPKLMSIRSGSMVKYDFFRQRAL